MAYLITLISSLIRLEQPSHAVQVCRNSSCPTHGSLSRYHVWVALVTFHFLVNEDIFLYYNLLSIRNFFIYYFFCCGRVLWIFTIFAK
ncbi:hypothetical protein NC653_002262 [Populus alba x Populus x berolinensis]|uniref:Secreted protein n=1 Tax=Populus alba x Populus x berolinensis TaxID=444605 RepID=A0AAD6RNF0_9ROSI|nr:hypothetical protein NC653_002262 [Populus alba x Populus x berolinensis]